MSRGYVTAFRFLSEESWADQGLGPKALTGIGAGGILTVVSILLSDIVTLEERGIWQGYVNMVFACGAGLGAPLGSLTLGLPRNFNIPEHTCSYNTKLTFST